MSLIKYVDYSGQWAQQKVLSAIAGKESEISPCDAIGLFTIFLCLHNSVDRYAGLPLESITVDAADRRLDVELGDNGVHETHPDHTNFVAERFAASVAELKFGLPGWTLNILKTGSGAMHTLQLPDYEKIR